MHRVTAAIVAVLVAATLVVPSAAQPSDPLYTHWECGKIDTYATEVEQILLDHPDLMELIEEDVDPTRMSNRQLRVLGSEIQSMGEDVLDLDAPKGVKEYAKATGQYLVTLGVMAEALANGGPLAAMAYVEEIEEIESERETGYLYAEVRCGDAFTSVFSPDSLL